jgi:hypothetical protein
MAGTEERPVDPVDHDRYVVLIADTGSYLRMHLRVELRRQTGWSRR